MLIKAILLGLVGIVGVIDSRLIGRQNIGRPLILSTLAGLVLGDVRQGVILGASLELISMGFVAIGAAGPPNMQFGSIIATAFAILSGASTEAALTIAVPVAVIGEFLSVIMRMVIAQFSHVADKAIENGQFKKAIHIHLWWSFGFNALVYFIPIFLTVYFGTDLVTNLVAAIPQVITNGLTVAGNLLSALGFAMLLSSMLSKKMFPYFLLGFLTHGRPCISDNNVCVLSSLHRVIGDEEVRVRLCECHNLSVRTVVRRRCDGNLHAGLEAADDQRVCHVVAVANVAHLETLKNGKLLADGHEVCQNLTRMAEISQTVDDRNRAVVCQILYFLLLVGADHNAVQIAAQHTCRVLYRLAAADLKVAIGQEQCLTAQLIHTGLERNTGTGGGLLENHAKALAFQMTMGNVVLFLILELIRQIEQTDDLLGGAVKQLQ